MASYQTATIAISESLTGEIDLTGLTLVGVIMPSAWTTADLTFQTGVVSGSLSNHYDQNDIETTVYVGASRDVQIDVQTFLGRRYMKIRSGTSGTPVAQAAARELTLVLVPALG